MKTGRTCLWCGQEEIRPDTLEEWDEWLKLPSACSAPDGDGHVWIEETKDGQTKESG